LEENRQLRFLIPPVIFLISLLWWGVVIDPHKPLLGLLKDAPILALGVGAAAVLALGFIISSISIFVLRLFGEYEAWFSDADLNLMREAINKKKGTIDKKQKLYLVATYGHGLVARETPGLYEWLLRRWNVFLVSFHSCFALILSLLIPSLLRGWEILSKSLFLYWWLPVIILILVFVTNACRAYKENRGMTKFLLNDEKHLIEKGS